MYASNLFGAALRIFAVVAGAVLWFVAFVVIVALIVLLVRFLLVGTRAARIYVAKNSPAKPAVPTPVPADSPVPAPQPTPAAKAAPPAARRRSAPPSA